jgi:hypothetical protein
LTRPTKRRDSVLTSSDGISGSRTRRELSGGELRAALDERLLRAAVSLLERAALLQRLAEATDRAAGVTSGTLRELRTLGELASTTGSLLVLLVLREVDLSTCGTGGSMRSLLPGDGTSRSETSETSTTLGAVGGTTLGRGTTLSASAPSLTGGHASGTSLLLRKTSNQLEQRRNKKNKSVKTLETPRNSCRALLRC